MTLILEIPGEEISLRFRSILQCVLLRCSLCPSYPGELAVFRRVFSFQVPYQSGSIERSSVATTSRNTRIAYITSGCCTAFVLNFKLCPHRMHFRRWVSKKTGPGRVRSTTRNRDSQTKTHRFGC